MIWEYASLLHPLVATMPITYMIEHERVDSYSVHILVGAAILQVLLKLSRLIPWTHPVFFRPEGAFNCNLINLGGDATGKIGMPSGHVMITTYMILMIITREKRPVWWKVAIAWVILYLVGQSRYSRRCHNLPQILVGYLFGVIAFFISKKLVEPKLKQLK